MSSSSAAAIRASLGHPVIDIDGHAIEYFPALGELLRDEGVDVNGPSMRRLLPAAFGPHQEWHDITPDERLASRVSRPPWWGAPAANTMDLATALLPQLYYDRLDEFGIDFGVVYPSAGLVFMHLEDPDERYGACRALNRHNAETYAPLSDRLAPVAAIPMHSPEEAIAALDHAVDELGFRTVLLAGYVQRPVPVIADNAAAAPWGTWLDMYGMDSAYDYDPVWARCRELGVSVAFHSGSIGWGARMSPSSYMFNHIGHLAEGQHSLAKSLFLGGVTRRFPELRFAFLEGGVAWAASLYADLIGHWEKRNRNALWHLDPANIDRNVLFELIGRHGGAWTDIDMSTAPRVKRPHLTPELLDEFAASGVESPEDIRDQFVTPFFFGCEADDPLTTTAFNTKVNPFGSRLSAMFGSDIAHWDVPDQSQVLDEAWELVEHELISTDDFADFVFGNPVRFHAGANPGFFKGTVVEDAVDSLLAGG